jgi:shikimate kinase
MNIFLIGFMGCGKTYWGKLWSGRSGLPFYDLDDMVEAQKGKTAADIFAEDGEDKFRDFETAALRSFSNIETAIVACGGGTPCYNDNIAWMNKNGTCIYLRSAPENILIRLMTETEKRPLIKNLQGNELQFYIKEKIKERDFFYEQAEIILDVDDLPNNYLPEFLIV